MTHKIIYIVLLIAGFFLLSSRSCVPDTDLDQEERLKVQQNKIRGEIEKDFGSAYLFEDQLIVYGDKARQKLLDFADYLSLYSDKSMDTLFKQQIRDILYSLFYKPDPLMQLAVVPGDIAENKQKSLSKLIGSIIASDYQSIIFSVYDLKTLEPLHRESDDQYTGSIRCNFRISGLADLDTTLLYNQCNRVKTIVTRTNKSFGEGKTMLVWQVFLEEIDTCPDGVNN